MFVLHRIIRVIWFLWDILEKNFSDKEISKMAILFKTFHKSFKLLNHVCVKIIFLWTINRKFCVIKYQQFFLSSNFPQNQGHIFLIIFNLILLSAFILLKSCSRYCYSGKSHGKPCNPMAFLWYSMTNYSPDHEKNTLKWAFLISEWLG